MQTIKPVYIYVFGTVVVLIGSSFKDSPAIHYTLLSLGIILVIFGIAKHFRDKK